MLQSQARSGPYWMTRLRTYGDVASGKLRAERVNDGLGGLARGAVADRDVRSKARGLAIGCMRPGDLMGCPAGGVIDRRQRLGRCDAEHDCFGMVADLTDGDGGCRRVGKKVSGCLGHLLQLEYASDGGVGGVRTWSARNARHRWIPLVSPG